MGCYTSSSTVANYVKSALKPEIDGLKKNFGAVSAKQQEQLDRIEAKVDALIAALTPSSLEKPPLVSRRKAGIES